MVDIAHNMVFNMGMLGEFCTPEWLEDMLNSHNLRLSPKKSTSERKTNCNAYMM
jgi:hypothetical protein